MSARQELEQIINFDMSGMIADRMAKVAWGKIGGSALKWGGVGAAGGALTGGISAAANGDNPVGGALGGATSGALLGAGGGALHSAGAFKGLLGTEEQIAARAAKKAAAGKAATATVAPAATGAKPRTPDAAGGNWNTEAPAKNTAVTDAITASEEKTKRAKSIASRLGTGARQQYIPQTSIMTPMLSAREELDSIIRFGKDQPAYYDKRDFDPKKKKPKGKPLSKKQQAEEDGQHCMSAREELEVIQLSLGPVGPARGAIMQRMFKKWPQAARVDKWTKDNAIAKTSLVASMDAAKELRVARKYEQSSKADMLRRRSAGEKPTHIAFPVRRGEFKQPGYTAFSNPQHCMSAMEELDRIELSLKPGRGAMMSIAADKLGRKKGHIFTGSELQLIQGRVPERGSIAGSKIAQVLKKFRSEKILSARDQLDSILQFGSDPRPRNPLGEFSGSEEGAPDHNAMRLTYSQAAATGAVSGAAGLGTGAALKALYTKLKGMKK